MRLTECLGFQFEHSSSGGSNGSRVVNPSSDAYEAAGGSPAYAIVDLTAAYSKQGAEHVFTPTFEQLV